MTSRDRERVARALVAKGKEILAVDETVATLTRRFDALGITSTEDWRFTYREYVLDQPQHCRIHQRCNHVR